jgi:hypothetical protein
MRRSLLSSEYSTMHSIRYYRVPGSIYFGMSKTGLGIMAELMNVVKLLKGPVIAIIVFYLLCVAMVFGMRRLTERINTEKYASITPDDPGSFVQAMDAYQQVINLLTTLATGLLAALGFLLINRPGQQYSAWDFWWAATSALFACVSLYWGYVSSQNVQVALEAQSLTLDIPILQRPRQLQFSSMVLGVVCVAHFAMKTLIKMESAGGEKSA